MLRIGKILIDESIIKVNSVYIFKHIYNLVCEEKAKNYKIQKIADNYDFRLDITTIQKAIQTF